MVVRMARGFARLEFPSTYTMLRDSLHQTAGRLTARRLGDNYACRKFPRRTVI